MPSFIALIFLFALTLSSHAGIAPLRAWLARQTTIRTLSCDFIQERKLPALKEPLSTPGRLVFQAPNKVRWELGEPPESLAVSEGKMFTLVDYTKRQAKRVAVGSPQALRFSLLSLEGLRSPQDFDKAFEVVNDREVAGIHQYTLRPQDRRMRRSLSWVFLDIDAQRNELRAMELELQDGTRIRSVFYRPQYNRELPKNIFAVDLSEVTLR